MYSGIARKWGGKEGYSLVEVSLALLVAGLGILAAFSLFPHGLDSSRKSVEATEMATFAGFVFENLQSDIWACSTNDNPLLPPTWASMFREGHYTQNMVHAFEYGGGGTQNGVLHTGPDRANAGLYAWKPAYWGSEQAVQLQSYDVTRFTYTLDLDDVPAKDLLTARLEIWPGDCRDTIVTSTGTVFYREFRRP